MLTLIKRCIAFSVFKWVNAVLERGKSRRSITLLPQRIFPGKQDLLGRREGALTCFSTFLHKNVRRRIFPHVDIPPDSD
jgi:hypothetical protein